MFTQLTNEVDWNRNSCKRRNIVKYINKIKQCINEESGGVMGKYRGERSKCGGARGRRRGGEKGRQDTMGIRLLSATAMK